MAEAKKKLFTFRTDDADTAKEWRLQAKVRGLTVDQMMKEAMEQYLKNNPLTKQQEDLKKLLGEVKR